MRVRTLLAGVCTTVLLAAASPLGEASAASGLEGFDPGNIISDAAFFSPDRMSADEVSAFIAERGAACVPGPDGTPCLKDYVSPIPEKAKTAYCDAVAPRTTASAAEVITASANACGINPQVLLVMLQKEQALITASGDRLYADRYTKAMGLGCPDFQACDPTRATFFGQVYGAAERFRIYEAHPSNYKHRVGQVNSVAYHPEPLCGTASFTIRNQATAGLYNYTPFVPNAASLAAVSTEGDLCSAYGNRNFYRYMKTWFPSAMSNSNAAPLQAPPGSTVGPEMTAIYQRAAQLGVGRLGPSTGAIVCNTGVCTKEYSRATISWTASSGTRVTGKLPRVAGADRFQTAVAASRQGFPNGATTVFLATGSTYADALAAGPWAQREGAALLLTSPDRLPSDVLVELRRLAPQRVILVGGERAVSAQVEQAVRGAVPTASRVRVAGADRYGTALAISRQGFASADNVHVATGRDFADALVGGPLTAGRGPLLLVPGTSAPSTEVVDEIRRLGASKVVLLGGTNALGVATEVGFRAVTTTERVAGQDRYATAVLVAERAAGSATDVRLVSGEVFPDALVAINLQSTAPGPLLLSRQRCVPGATSSWLQLNTKARVTLVGGESALTDAVGTLTPCSG